MSEPSAHLLTNDELARIIRKGQEPLPPIVMFAAIATILTASPMVAFGRWAPRGANDGHLDKEEITQLRGGGFWILCRDHFEQLLQ